MNTYKLIVTALFLFAAILSAQTLKPNFANVEYAAVNGISLTLDIYLPQQAENPFPIVVWIHGGGWQAGSKESVNGTWLLQKGFGIVSINYRLTDKAIYPGQINDCKGAIRWLRANATKYNFDPDKIGVFGSSAGGHLAALVGSSGDVQELEGIVGGNLNVSSRVQAVCDWYGPANFMTICGTVPPTSNHCDAASPEGKLIGGDLRTNPEKCKSVSPISYVSKDDPPFLIMHGTADGTVPFTQSVELDSAYRSIIHDVTFIPQPGAGHGGGSFGADSTKKRITDFFTRVLMKTTSVDKETLPAAFQLLQNYPNPFNPETIINFTIPNVETTRRVVFTTLKVYWKRSCNIS
ncbi:MAG: peptidase S9 prolyl oligopeptidase active site domain-containing protein [Stygiobacter sp.]|nr:MAG: peptidase S9 prolyl oligopeptidase active site domain-containing protein [Stygiobacter sp.]